MSYKDPIKEKKYKKQYNKNWYQRNKNKDSFKNRIEKNRKRLIKRNMDFVKGYLEEHPCVDCGEKDLMVLVFDHMDAVGGEGARVSTLYHNSWSLKRIKEEIKKCEVRCANCHMRRTAEQFGWKNRPTWA